MKGKNALVCALFALALSFAGCTTITPLPNTDITYAEVDVERMSRKLGIPEHRIAEAFGVHESEDPSFAARLAAADTYGKALELYWTAPWGSQLEDAALVKAATLINTYEEAEYLYWNVAPPGSAGGKVALTKLATFFPEEK